MKLILLPDSGENVLGDVYSRAFANSIELYIVSAYLTHWDIKTPLGKQCTGFKLIVGKDFGITRKKACLDVMGWLDNSRRGQFFVADDIEGFHPKAMFWREEDGRRFALVGSSNLSRAAFRTNHEVNAFSEIDVTSFEAAKIWIDSLANRSVVVSEHWLNEYSEAVQPPKKTSINGPQGPVVELPLPAIDNYVRLQPVLKNRRRQMQVFSTKRMGLEAIFRAAVATNAKDWSTTCNDEFYKSLNHLWVFGDGGCRFQGPGWERQGKSSNFRELSLSLIRVIDSNESERDEVVTAEIDRLSSRGVSTRKSVFSEMLCQFFSQQYPVLNSPVKSWLESTNFAAPKKATEGVRYIDLTRKLRLALKRTPKYPAKNLAELDAIVWLSNQAS
jgi:hypothetical protein